MNESKLFEAKATLQLAADMSKYYYDKPLIICYSGGKDSDVLLDIALKCLKHDDFEVLNAHTTVDAPDTVYHIRNVFKRLSSLGIKTTIQKPVYHGKPITMWDLIVKKGIPPTRIMRYCCSVLKEAATPNRIAAVGVRESESNNRRGRDIFGVRSVKVENREYRTLQHTNTMFIMDKKYKDKAHHKCVIIEQAKKQKDLIVNRIYHWSDSDIWEYVRINNIDMNPLYSKGYKRVGCVGCPLSSDRTKSLADNPAYIKNYISAFDRMLKNRPEKLRKYNFKTGEEVFRWWLGDDPNQITINEIMKEV